VASAVLLTAAGIFVFLAYATTSVVARQLGAGSPSGAISAGLDGLWLALLTGAATGVLVGVLASPFSSAFGASEAAHEQAVTYLRISALGIPGMLVILAVTGVLRGLQDTRTPLVVSVLGFGANVALNLLLVFGLRWGIAGSAWGTVIAQTGMAMALSAVLVRGARRLGAPRRPHPRRILRAGAGGLPLLVRTLALRAVLLLTTWAAAGLGDSGLAAHQVTMTVWSSLVFALDALAIAAQAMTGRSLGAGDWRGARETTRTMVQWGCVAGVVLGVALILGRWPIARAFTTDPEVAGAIALALVVVALSQPLAGYVFVVDGVLIGAGDGRWLAAAMTLTLALYVPAVSLARSAGGAAMRAGMVDLALRDLWVAFTVFMLIRGATLWWRLRGSGWVVTGATR